LFFCAGVAGAVALVVAGGWSCNTNGWARLHTRSSILRVTK
jgi:hypothetical protein